jgi:hypothetical protein
MKYIKGLKYPVERSDRYFKFKGINGLKYPIERSDRYFKLKGIKWLNYPIEMSDTYSGLEGERSDRNFRGIMSSVNTYQKQIIAAYTVL